MDEPHFVFLMQSKAEHFYGIDRDGKVWRYVGVAGKVGYEQEGIIGWRWEPGLRNDEGV